MPYCWYFSISCFPPLSYHLDKKYTLVNRIGTVVICYGMGLLIGNIGMLPDGIAAFQETIYSACVILAIPLLLFSLDIRKWISMAGKTMLSLVARYCLGDHYGNPGLFPFQGCDP